MHGMRPVGSLRDSTPLGSSASTKNANFPQCDSTRALSTSAESDPCGVRARRPFSTQLTALSEARLSLEIAPAAIRGQGRRCLQIVGSILLLERDVHSVRRQIEPHAASLRVQLNDNAFFVFQVGD
jgi:hypothetical protein